MNSVGRKEKATIACVSSSSAEGLWLKGDEGV